MKKRIVDFEELWEFLNIKNKELEDEYKGCEYDDFYNKQRILDKQSAIIDIKFWLLKATHYVEIKEKGE